MDQPFQQLDEVRIRAEGQGEKPEAGEEGWWEGEPRSWVSPTDPEVRGASQGLKQQLSAQRHASVVECRPVNQEVMV